MALARSFEVRVLLLGLGLILLGAAEGIHIPSGPHLPKGPCRPHPRMPGLTTGSWSIPDRVTGRLGPLIEGVVADVTKFGAIPDGKTPCDSAFLKAWNAACRSIWPSKIVIPQGQFVLGDALFFQGRCVSKPITIEIQGTMLGISDLSEFAEEDFFVVQDLDAVTILGGGTFNGLGQSNWGKMISELPASFVFKNISNGVVQNINSVNSQGYHMKIIDCRHFSVERFKITAPANSPSTRGIHIETSEGVRVSDGIIGTGDDCISVGAGSSDVNIRGITCGPGNGISVTNLGKEVDEDGVSGIVVSNSTLSQTRNGLRIETSHNSRPLQAWNMTFHDIIMNDVTNPILINQHIFPPNKALKKQPASLVKVRNVHFRNIRGTSASNVAVKLDCSNVAPCEGIELDNVDFTPSPKCPKKLPLSSSCKFAKTVYKGKHNPPPCK